ncbi:MAG: hypothetical protein Q9159_006831 [Coniocarpon cinnabarinum]
MANGTEDAAPPPPPPPRVQKRKQPPSLEDILKEKQAADDAAARPRFISKKERENLLKQKMAKEPPQPNHNQGSKFPSPASNGIKSPASKGSKVSGTSSASAASIPTGPAAMRPPQEPTVPTLNGQQSRKTAAPRQTEEEAIADYVKQRYYGVTPASTFSASKKRKRTTDKKFNFDWSPEEDTSQDYNPLYQNRIDPYAFSRGHRGGMDTDDRAIHNLARSIAEHDPENGEARAQQLIEMEKRRKERNAKRMLDMRHWSEKKLSEMKPRDWRLVLSEYNISTKGSNLPPPARSWPETGLPQTLLDTVESVGYTDPSPIQRAAIPIAMSGRDVIGLAETGSGKTASFALPLLHYISSLPPVSRENPGPYAVILAPTRELAQQITVETQKLAAGRHSIVSITGGRAIEEQVWAMRDGAEIIVATPGRLVDCIERRLVILQSTSYVVLDEADRMIDMGFTEPLEKILAALPSANEKPDTDDLDMVTSMSVSYRQTMMYSATMSSTLERVARGFLRRPAVVQIGEANTGVDTVVQQAEYIPTEDKRKNRLRELLNQRDKFPPPVIVFVNVKRACDTLARDIRGMGFSAETLHGSKTQEQREKALASLRNGGTDILVATDLASRGIDVEAVSLVVNFSLPSSIEPYLHRIGRTGRAGKSGVAISFWSNEDADVLYELKNVIQRSSISKVPDDLKKHPAAQQKQKGLHKMDEDQPQRGRK